MFKIYFILACCFIACTNSLNLCGDWTQYEDIKCVKVLERKGTGEGALGDCTQLEKSSTLITIHSKGEQKFLEILAEKYQNISLNVWTGLKFHGSSYEWLDKSQVNYTNWADDAVKDGSDPCVQMSLQKQTLGKWSDVSCKKTALIICQKDQEFSLNSFKDILDNLTKVVDKVTEEFKTKNQQLKQQINSLIPLGFLYTQLPHQSSPQQLWPNMKWSDVTKDYAGLFFRAEGEGSEKFEIIQAANQSWISDVHAYSFHFKSWNGVSSFNETHKMEFGKWARVYSPWAIDFMDMFTTAGEVRPRNTAIKIWKRIH